MLSSEGRGLLITCCSIVGWLAIVDCAGGMGGASGRAAACLLERCVLSASLRMPVSHSGNSPAVLVVTGKDEIGGCTGGIAAALKAWFEGSAVP